MANQHSSRQSWVAADMRPVRNSRQHLAASTNENRRQSPRTLQEKSRAPLLSGNPHIGKRPPHTDSNANACPPPHQSQPTATNSLVALAGKMVHQSITMAPESAAVDCHEPEAEIAARDAPVAFRLAATRAMVADGMTSTHRRGPNTIMPTARPAASKARPPSALRRTQTTSADPRRTSGTEGLSPKLPSNLDISDFGHSGRPLGRV